MNDLGSQANLDSTAITDGSSPPDGDGADVGDEECDDDIAEMPPTKRPRLENEEPPRSPEFARPELDNDDSRFAALQKLLQQSPARHFTERNGIQTDDSLSPSTRRLLFPSPRKEGEVKTLEGISLNTSPTQLRRSPRGTLQPIAHELPNNVQQSDSFLSTASRSSASGSPSLRRSPRINKHSMLPGFETPKPVNKENDPPALEKENDGFDHLFEDDEDNPAIPSTPPPKPRWVERAQFKMPSAPAPAIPGDANPEAPSTPMRKSGPSGSSQPETSSHAAQAANATVPSTPTPNSRSSQRNQFETPSPATQAANLVITPGQKSTHVKHVMKLMFDSAPDDPEKSRDFLEALDRPARQLSPTTDVFAELLRTVCRENIASHGYKASPKKPMPRRKSPQAASNQPQDAPYESGFELEDLELPNINDDWANDGIYADFPDPLTGPDTGADGGDEYEEGDDKQAPPEEEEEPWCGVEMTGEEELQRIEVLMGRA